MATAKAALVGAVTNTLPNASSPELSVQTSSRTAPTVSTAAGSSTTALQLSTPAPMSSTPPPLTEQIANLLNLAQYMLNSVRQEQEQQQQQEEEEEEEIQQHRRQTRKERRNFRLQANTPYQRPGSEAYQAAESVNGSATNATNTSSSVHGLEWRVGGGHSEADGRSVITNVAIEQPIMSQTPFHSSGRSGSGRRHNSTHSSSHHHKHGAHRGDNANFRCSICLDSYLLHRPMVTQCGHLFCKRCIRKCVRGAGKCPMCNCKLNSNSVFRVYF